MPHVQTETLKAVLTNPATFSFTLLTVFLDIYGMEALAWHPATIQMDLEQDFGIDMPAANYDRLMTAVNLFTTNNFFVSTPDFARTCVALSGHHPTPNLMQLPSAEDIAWGITEALLIHPPEDHEEEPFSKEITGFIGEVLNHEGILNPPDVLKIASRDRKSINQLGYEYAGDQETFSGITEMDQARTTYINHIIDSRLRGLLMQLSTLPLQHGNATELATKLLKKLPSRGSHEILFLE